MTQLAFRTRVRTINRPDAFVILKGLLRSSPSNSAPVFLNACMRVGNKLGLPFTEGVILASYAVWLEDNPKGNLSSFLSAQDYSIVFGSYTKNVELIGLHS